MIQLLGLAARLACIVVLCAILLTHSVPL